MTLPTLLRCFLSLEPLVLPIPVASPLPPHDLDEQRRLRLMLDRIEHLARDIHATPN